MQTSPEKKPGLQDLIKTVREIAESNPNRVYYSTSGCCSYVTSDDRPEEGCLVGEALMRLGVPREFLSKTEEIYAGYPDIYRLLEDGLLADHLRYDLNSEADGDRASWLLSVQEFQDDGSMWEMSVYFADQRKPLV